MTPTAAALVPQQGGPETKFTPGPWSVCGDGKCSCKTVMAPDHPIAKITAGEWGDDYPAIRIVGDSSLTAKAEAYMEKITYGEISEPVARANALLIAAAPEMVAAGDELAAAAADIHPTAPSSASVDRLHAAMDAWDALIARATGAAS